MEKELNSLLEKISEAAFDDSLWVEILDHIRRDLGGSHALLFTPDLGLADPEGLWASPYLTPDDLQEYIDYYHTKDLWTLYGFDKGVMRTGCVFLGQELVSDKEFTRSEYYSDYTRNMDIRQLVAATVHAGTAKIPRVMMSVYGSNKSDPFEETARETYSRLVKQIKNSFLLRTQRVQFSSKSDSIWHFILRRNEAIFLLDQNLKVIEHNQKADRLLLENSDIYLRNDKIHLKNNAGYGQLMSAVNKAKRDSNNLFPDTTFFSIHLDKSKWPVLLKVEPVPRSFSLNNETPSVMITAKGIPIDTADQLESFFTQFGITPAEQALCEKLLLNYTLPEIARILGIKESTVRQRIKDVFQKTNCHSQAQLVRLVNSYI